MRIRLTVAAVFAFPVFGVVSACALRPPPATYGSQLPAELPAGRPVAIIGDLQQTSDFVLRVMRREHTAAVQERLVADLQAHAGEIGALVIVGDLVFTAASRSDWRRFDTLVAPIARAVPVLAAIGNHDYYCVFVQKCIHAVVPKSYRRRFPWSAPGRPQMVAWGDTALLLLDTETDLEAQGVWLEQTLAALGPRFRAALVLFHRPPYTNAVTRGSQPDSAVQSEIVSRLRTSPITSVVIAGHVHGYEHLVVDGRHYVTTGGGGGPRVMLGADRPGDVYAGPDCLVAASGEVRRPFNYLLVERRDDAIAFTVRGLCKGDPAVAVLERFAIPLPAAPRGAARGRAVGGSAPRADGN